MMHDIRITYGINNVTWHIFAWRSANGEYLRVPTRLRGRNCGRLLIKTSRRCKGMYYVCLKFCLVSRALQFFDFLCYKFKTTHEKRSRTATVNWVMSVTVNLPYHCRCHTASWSLACISGIMEYTLNNVFASLRNRIVILLFILISDLLLHTLSTGRPDNPSTENRIRCTLCELWQCNQMNQCMSIRSHITKSKTTDYFIDLKIMISTEGNMHRTHIFLWWYSFQCEDD